MKHIRCLAGDDIERVLRQQSRKFITKGLPVIVSPNGMRGRLTGCCPVDIVNQLYARLKASDEIPAGAPSIMRSAVCLFRGQKCFVEVTLGYPSCSDRSAEAICSDNVNAVCLRSEDPCTVSSGKCHHTGSFPKLERTFVYPVEFVLVPVFDRAFARSSFKRFFLQILAGTSPFELWPFWNFSTLSEHRSQFLEELAIDFGGTGLKRKYNSSSNSTCSSTSSTSSTSSASDHAAFTGATDLEADADSLTSRQSGLSSNDQLDNDGNRMVAKRIRSSVIDTFGQVTTVGSETAQSLTKSEYSVVDVVDVAGGGSANAQVGSNWDWEEDERGIGVDIQVLLSEFGDFGDFFESDVLTFGEPPGTAESQALVFPSIEGGDLSGSPYTMGIDSPDQKISTVGLTSFENFNQSSVTSMEDTQSICVDTAKDSKASATTSHTLVLFTGKFDYLKKAEAVLTFAPEYAAVEMSSNEFCTSIFRNPYLPCSKRVESSQISSNAYIYSAAPPLIDDSEENPEKSCKVKLGNGGYGTTGLSGKLYTQVQSGTKEVHKRLFNVDMPTHKGQNPSSLCVKTSSSGISVLPLMNDKTIEAGHFLLSLKTVLATEIECIMFQAAMCRIRHMLVSFNCQVPLRLNKRSENAMLDVISCDASSIHDVLPTKHEARKNDALPVRIAGDVDVGMHDASVAAPVGVWRPVGVPKGTEPSNKCMFEKSPSLQNNSANEESVHGQRQALQEFLDALGFLVQQSASFVDVALDTDDTVGPYSWLALQEQQRRGFSCGPSMVHAGCGGILATCHYVDIAGVDLMDPLSADVQVSTVISMLQSDIKSALKSAFASLDGPLSLTEWCRGRHQSGDSGTTGDGYSFQCNLSEAKDSLSNVTMGGDPISSPQSTSSSREGIRIDDSSQKRLNQEVCSSDSETQKLNSRLRPTLSVLPLPLLLVGYQDDWLKTSVSCLPLWEKAPLEPYALPKPVSYFAVCPDIDLLTSAATDFFQQLGTVYEACKLGSHTPHNTGSIVESSPGKLSSSGLVLVNCPQELKALSGTMPISSINDYFVALSKSWNLTSYVNSLKKVLLDLHFTVTSSTNQKEGNTGPCMVVYVVCPFPGHAAVLQTVIQCSKAIGSVALSLDKEKQSLLHSHVAKALCFSAAADEASVSSVVMLSGFRIPKLVLQIVTVDSLLRLNRPAKELAILKELAFTVYNKVRRIPRAVSSAADIPLNVPSRGQSTLMHVNSPIPGIWKDCLAPRISSSVLARETELDSALRPATWDNSWQTRVGGLNFDSSRSVELLFQDDPRYLFEPLFILAEPGFVEHEPSGSKSAAEDNSCIYMQTSTSGGATEIGKGSLVDGSEHDCRPANLHCCYGWTEDWCWLICIWTDSRGELLDCGIFPFGGISSRQDTKVLQNLFIQVLHHSCQILSSLSDLGNIKQRDMIITRIGCFFELECQEWQKAIYSVGGNDVKKWPIQLRRAIPDAVLANNGTSLEQQEMGLIQERTLPSSPSPSLYSTQSKSSFIKGSLGQANAKKPMLGGQTGLDSSKGLLHLIRSISLVSVSMDHSLHLIIPAHFSSAGGQNNVSTSFPSYLEGFIPVKSLGSLSTSYLLIPSPSMRFLPPSPFQLPTCLTSESPPLTHLLHSKGSAIPQSTGFVISKSVPTMRRDPVDPLKEDWPSILAVSLVDHYGGGRSSLVQEKLTGRGSTGSTAAANKQGRSIGPEAYEMEAHLVLESVAAELHALSWMTVSPLYVDRRSALPFHCDMLLRLRRLLHYADKEFSRPPSDQPDLL
ncbi:Mediator of RNA polymerase II transcription subunit 13 [Apostasia shenzhenica]|uniref:Mediator of RNA polymerase II transcription subunit 13 n=1 Tax=Apostasia shenzhenica TaxID=1088818 RepID=A0A2H9ZWA5_9ASPA|nr:Mediator of RNA polymerase II transcription subunit 13 [Apostasia shenzhenica]